MFWKKKKPTRTIEFGVQVKRCDVCRRGGEDVAGCYFCEDVAGCYFCEDAGVHHVVPIGHQDGLGVLRPKYCFNCGRPVYIPELGETED